MNYHHHVGFGFLQDYYKAFELFIRAGELGHADAYSYCNVGCAYSNGNGAEIDKKKANLYYVLAASSYGGKCGFEVQGYEHSQTHDCSRRWPRLFIERNPRVVYEWKCNDG